LVVTVRLLGFSCLEPSASRDSINQAGHLAVAPAAVVKGQLIPARTVVWPSVCGLYCQ